MEPAGVRARSCIWQEAPSPGSRVVLMHLACFLHRFPYFGPCNRPGMNRSRTQRGSKAQTRGSARTVGVMLPTTVPPSSK